MEPGEKDLWFSGVPESLAILEAFGYKSEYSLSLKMLFLFNLRNVLVKACSRFIVGSCVNVLNFFYHK